MRAGAAAASTVIPAGLPAESSTSTHAVGGAGPRSSSSSPAARRGRGGSQGFQRGRSRPTRCFPISCDPREQETICTAVAAGAVATVGTRGDVGLPATSRITVIEQLVGYYSHARQNGITPERAGALPPHSATMPMGCGLVPAYRQFPDRLGMLRYPKFPHEEGPDDCGYTSMDAQ